MALLIHKGLSQHTSGCVSIEFRHRLSPVINLRRACKWGPGKRQNMNMKNWHSYYFSPCLQTDSLCQTALHLRPQMTPGTTEPLSMSLRQCSGSQPVGRDPAWGHLICIWGRCRLLTFKAIDIGRYIWDSFSLGNIFIYIYLSLGDKPDNNCVNTNYFDP